MRTFKDGNQWCAVADNFINLQESPAGFADGKEGAVAALVEEQSSELAAAKAEAERLQKEIGTCHKCGKALAVMEAICWPCFSEWEARTEDRRKAGQAKKDLTP